MLLSPRGGRAARGPLALACALACLLALCSAAEAQATRPETGGGAGTGGAPPPSGGSGAGKAGGGFAEFRVGVYQNGDGKGDGNPFLDEKLTVVEPVLVLEYQATERLKLSATLSYDQVSSASIDRLSNYPEQTGASGDYYVGGSVGARYAPSDDLRFGGFVGYGAEYDYQSFSLGADLELDLLEKNTTLKLGVVAFLDQVRVIRFDGSEKGEGDESRRSLTFNLGLYQVLSPTLHMTLSYGFTHQSGFLATAFNGVVLEDPNAPLPEGIDPDRLIDLSRLPPGVSLVAEELPDTRLRHVLTGEARKLFPSVGTALGLGGRLYADSWGIVSGTAEVSLHQWLVRDHLRARLRYRFYTQSSADDYERRFYVPLGARPLDRLRPGVERTQDADLAAFYAQTIGAQLTWRIDASWQVEVAFDYVLRSDGIDQVLAAFGVRWTFGP